MRDPIFNEAGFQSSPCGPPRASGVYAICVMPDRFFNPGKPLVDHVVYVGSSKNILQRIMNPAHVYRRLCGRLKKYWVYTMFIQCDDFVELERELIRKYKPRFNRYKYGA